MSKYIDKKLYIDSTYTQKELSWQPTKQFHILNRSLYLVEKMKSQPEAWHFKNSRAIKRISRRPTYWFKK